MVCLPKEREGMELSDDELVAAAKRVIESEARELLKAASRIGYEMAEAARLICGCKGRVVVVGLGKSGHVARKIAATFSSLGTPAFFLHAAEGAHGDLGMVCREDVGLFLSNSGHTQEVLELLPFFKRLGAPVISITGNLSSPLAEASDLVLDSSVEREADRLGLAPTSSTALQMAIGDALAAMVTELRGSTATTSPSFTQAVSSAEGSSCASATSWGRVSGCPWCARTSGSATPYTRFRARVTALRS